MPVRIGESYLHHQQLFVQQLQLLTSRKGFEMAGQRASGPFFRSLQRASSSTICGRCLKLQRTLASQAGAATSGPPDKDLVDSSSLGVPPLPEDAHTFDPLKSSRGRKRQLPPSRSVRFFSFSTANWWSDISTDINTDLQSTTVAHSTRTVLHQPLIRLHERSFLVPFPLRAWKQHITIQLPQTL